MCNCNQKVSYSSPNQAKQAGAVLVKLIGKDSIVMNGSITGRMYIFRNINDTNWVDKRDALALEKVDGLMVVY